MIRWICGVKLEDRKSMFQLRSLLRVHDLRDVIRRNRLQWYGHVLRMPPERWPKQILDFEVEGQFPVGRPKKRWMDNVANDLKKLCISEDLAHNRNKWREAISFQKT